MLVVSSLSTSYMLNMFFSKMHLWQGFRENIVKWSKLIGDFILWKKKIKISSGGSNVIIKVLLINSNLYLVLTVESQGLQVLCHLIALG